MTLSPADHKLRSNGVGSSEIAMLVYVPDEHGDMKPLSPWGGAHKLWRQKTGKEEDKPAKSYMTRGTYMETGLINWYADDTGVAWIKPKSLRHDKFPFVVDSVDGLTFPSGTTVKLMRQYLKTGEGATPLRCVEAKTSSFWARDEWGEAGTDEIPQHYLVQAQWHLGIHATQDGICDVPMDDGSRRTDYHVPYDDELYMALVDRAESFWRDHVEKEVEPNIDDYADTTKWLSKYLAQKAGMGFLEADEEQVQMLLQYRKAALLIKVDINELEKRKEALQRIIGEYQGIQIPGSKQRISWNKSKDSMGIDWSAVSETLWQWLREGKPFDQGDYAKLQDANNKVTKKGSRRWTPEALIKNES